MGWLDNLFSRRSDDGNETNERLSKIRVYISYSRADGQVYAEHLSEWLASKGVGVLLSEGRPFSGNQWAAELRILSASAYAFVLLCTPKSGGFMWAQAGYFSSRGEMVLPIFFDNSNEVAGVPYPLIDLPRIYEPISALEVGPTPDALHRVLEALGQIPEKVRNSRPMPQPLPVLDERRPLNEGKLILIGRGEVGKTSIVTRLIEDDFNGEEAKTQGILIKQWPLRLGTESFRLNVWDFGGQEIMHATHQFFLTERSLYLLVLNGREGGEDLDAEYWLRLIEGFGGDSPVIVVQNKIKQHPFELNCRGLRARYPQIRDFVKTDCRDRTGLVELRKLIESALATMPEVRMEIAADWLRVKERMESLGEEFLSYQKFSDLCAKEGVRDESDCDALSFVLHCLGIALNYRSDLRLRETSILKPEWVTQGIYKILNAETLAERRGELRLEDLQDILPRDRYPLDKHLFLMELMRKFSLCFPFEGEDARYLVPELLGKEEPEEVVAFQPEHCLNFEYRYGVLPEGLLPRFIVRTHQLSRAQPRWRSGVILAYEACKALVEAEPGERRVLVRVQGGDAGTRRNLLAIVRYDLDRIHAEFKDRLDVQAMVPLAVFPACAIDYQKLVAFERQGVKEFPEFVGQQVIAVRVSELLNGVDFDEQRNISIKALNRAKSLFFSYSHKDEGLRDELETHLKLLQRQCVISTWHDRKLLSGEEWDREIDIRLEQAAIILLLVSSDFIASDYCWEREVRRALERHEAGQAVVIPVLLRSCDIQSVPFGKLQWLPAGAKPVTTWTDRDAAWTNVASGIRAIAERWPLSGTDSL